MSALAVLTASTALAHGDHDPGTPQGADEQQSRWLDLVSRAAAAQQMEIDERQGFRFVRADGLPNHATGAFPNRSNPNRKPVLIGWAADGFAIYFDAAARSSWRLKSQRDPGGPGGRPDGTYAKDYEYVRGLGDLDECNGREGVTAEFPQGTYYYLVTAKFPFVPRCFMGTADASFVKQGGPPPAPPGDRRPRPLR